MSPVVDVDFGCQHAGQDDWYEGFLIPKGTTVIPNVWGMNHDPTIYPAPDVFRPERFLAADGTTDVAPPDTHGQGHVSFGFGRRSVSVPLLPLPRCQGTRWSG